MIAVAVPAQHLDAADGGAACGVDPQQGRAAAGVPGDGEVTRAVPTQPDSQPGIDGCGCDTYQGQFDLSVAPDMDPVFLDAGVAP